MSTQASSSPQWGVLLPLILFLGVGGLFLFSLATSEKGGKSLPSALIGKQIPEFDLPELQGLKSKDGQPFPSFSSETLKKKGKLSIVNVWASWCTSCRYEHPFLEELAHKTGADIYGLNHKDSVGKANSFLAKFGNPYKAVGTDYSGRVGIDFGVYGMPETFLVDETGKIIFKQIGPVNSKIINEVILPAVQKSRNQKNS